MPSNKPSLQVALFARGTAKSGEQDTYHWALLVTPKWESTKTTGHKSHVTNTQPVDGHTTPPWQYITLPLPNPQPPNLLIRITVAKVVDLALLQHILSGVPLQQNDRSFTCRTWVADAIAALDQQSPGCLGTRKTGDWMRIQERATRYARQKKDAGRWRVAAGEGKRKWKAGLPATWSLLEDRQTIP